MLAEERHQKIIETIIQTGNVKVKDLSARFDVTEDCIRKDLTLLERRGLLRKTYGGAVSVRIAAHDFQVSDRSTAHVAEKRVIAERALAFIHDGDMIFLDISSTNMELASLLLQSGRNVTVVTNCLGIMQLLNVPGSVRLIGLGGMISEKHGGFVGSMTISQLSAFQFDAAFIGAAGLNPANGKVSTYLPEDGITKQAAIQHSGRTYLMLETRKLREDGTFLYGQLDDFTGIIMDSRPAEQEIKLLKKYNTQLIYE